MKSAAVITIDDSNYGNRLQNYAVQTVLEKLGIDVVTISFLNTFGADKLWVLKSIVHRLTGYKLTDRRSYWEKHSILRIMKFKKFNRRYICLRHINSIEDIGCADYYVVGSDQVWNAELYDDCDLKKDLFLLTFARSEQRVCFSPSFGTDKIPDEWILWFKKHLEAFPDFSVREEAGARLIKELVGREATVTIDPTLMLDKEDWLKIVRKPKRIDFSKGYILTYFLGGRSEKLNGEIAKYSEKLGNVPIYNLADSSQYNLSIVDPSEFIYLIANARLVLTDSFHACVFSFLFGKPFLCYDRVGLKSSMNSRIETLFDKFDLKRKYVNSGLPNDLSECDYSNGYAALKSEREKMICFLKRSMQI